MTRAPIVVVHPEPDSLQQIVNLLRPMEYPFKTAVDLRTAAAVHRETPIGLCVTPDIRVPLDRQRIVEGLQRASLRIPVIVLVEERAEEKCPKAVNLLMGLQHYLVWPEESEELRFHVRGLLRTNEMMRRGSEGSSARDWVVSLRVAGEAQQRREVLNAMRATSGNISRAAELLGLSRGGLHYRLRKYGILPGFPAERKTDQTRFRPP